MAIRIPPTMANINFKLDVKRYEWKPPNVSTEKTRFTRSFSGCDECKRRKVRCGQEKPACVNCQKSKHPCNYSPRKINVYNPNASRGSSQDSPSRRSSQDTMSPRLPSSPEIRQLRRSSTTPEQDIMWSKLEESFRPKHTTWLGCDHYEWLKTVIAAPKNVALEQMLNALALGRIAFLEEDEQKMTSSYRGYVETLTSIQEALGNLDDVRTEQTMAAIRGACLYEAMFPSSDDGSSAQTSHWHGLVHLLETREPESGWGDLGQATVRSLMIAEEERMLYTHMSPGSSPVLCKAKALLDSDSAADFFRLEIANQVSQNLNILGALDSLSLQYSQTCDLGNADLSFLGSQILAQIEQMSTRIQQVLTSHNVMLSDLISPQGADIPFAIVNAASLVTMHSSQMLILIDQVTLFEDLTAISFAIPALRDYVNAKMRIELAARIIKLLQLTVSGPQEIGLAFNHGSHQYVAHETLAVLDASMLPDSFAVRQMHAMAGNGIAQHYLQHPGARNPQLRRFAFSQSI